MSTKVETEKTPDFFMLEYSLPLPCDCSGDLKQWTIHSFHREYYQALEEHNRMLRWDRMEIFESKAFKDYYKKLVEQEKVELDDARHIELEEKALNELEKKGIICFKEFHIRPCTFEDSYLDDSVFDEL